VTDRPSIARSCEDDLRRLRVQIIVMGVRVEDLISTSMRALSDRDAELARRTIASDCAVDRHAIAIDELCRDTLELHQPVTADLRFVISACKLATDLERIADLGVSISQSVLDRDAETPLKLDPDLPRMAAEVGSMLHESLRAFLAGDANRAELVIARDKLVADFSAQIFRRLFAQGAEDVRCITQAVRLQAVVKCVERIADHITNLCKMVVLMVPGEDARQRVKPGGAMRAIPDHEGN
jgi:phosphate transport system protein